MVRVLRQYVQYRFALAGLAHEIVENDYGCLIVGIGFGKVTFYVRKSLVEFYERIGRSNNAVGRFVCVCSTTVSL